MKIKINKKPKKGQYAKNTQNETESPETRQNNNEVNSVLTSYSTTWAIVQMT